MFFKQLQQIIIDIPSLIFSIKQGLGIQYQMITVMMTGTIVIITTIIPLNMNMIINIHTLLME